jgi:phosphopantetheinyl transferase
MPLVRTIQAAAGTKIGIWRITEPEEFFSRRVSLDKQVHHPARRIQHLAVRYLLEEIEASFPTARIRVAGAGKPYLPDESFHFSLSHSGDYAVAIVGTDGPVGVDVEKITPKIERIAAKFLRPEELAFLSGEDRTAHLTTCWCIKESVIKWYGKGGVDFREDIRLAPFPDDGEGKTWAYFQKDGPHVTLPVRYLGTGDYQLAWIAGTPT